MAIYFGKDVLAAVVYLSVFLAYRRREVLWIHPPFLLPLLLMIWFGIMQIFNPGSPTIWYGLLGMKLFFYYVPLLFVGYAFIEAAIESPITGRSVASEKERPHALQLYKGRIFQPRALAKPKKSRKSPKRPVYAPGRTRVRAFSEAK